MKNEFLDRYFGAKKFNPQEIKSEYEQVAEKVTKIGVTKLQDSNGLYTAFYNDGNCGYLVNEYDEAEEMAAGKVECSYKDENGDFFNLGQRYYFSGTRLIVSHTGFSMNENGDVNKFNSQQAEGLLIKANDIIKEISCVQDAPEANP